MNPNVLEKYRKKKKLSITDLSRKMGKTPGWYSRVRNGKQGLKNKYIPQLAEIFGLKPDRLAKEIFFENQLEDTSSSD